MTIDDPRFAPPPEDSGRPLELDPAWVAARAEKQAAAHRPPARPARQIGGVIVAILLIAVVVAVIVWLVRR